MKNSEWVIGALIGIVSGMGIRKMNQGPSLYKMKYQRKKAHLFANGETEYLKLQSAKEKLQTEAEQNIN